jgi:hypothetical protein
MRCLEEAVRQILGASVPSKAIEGMAKPFFDAHGPQLKPLIVYLFRFSGL